MCAGDQRTIVLDVAGGTGDIAFRVMDAMRASLERPAQRPHVIVCDINPAMLDVGRQRADELGYTCAWPVAAVHRLATASSMGRTPLHSSSLMPHSKLSTRALPIPDTTYPPLARRRSAASLDAEMPAVSWVAGDAEQLPIASESIDLFTIAFGIRNVTRVDAALREAYRVLRPGGRFMCLEFSHVHTPGVREVYDAVRRVAVARRVVPGEGTVVGDGVCLWLRRGGAAQEVACSLAAHLRRPALARAAITPHITGCAPGPTLPSPVTLVTPTQYSFNVIPLLGHLVANDRAAYQYLVESIRRFPDQAAFSAMIRDAGFADVSHVDFTLGVCAVHSGFKLAPAAPTTPSVERDLRSGW